MSAAATTMIPAARRTQEWLRGRPRLMDALFAGLIGLLALAELNSGSIGEVREADWLGVGLVLAGAGSLVWRRVFPAGVFGFILALSFVYYVRDYGSFMSPVGLSGVFAVAAHERNRRIAWLVLIGGWIGLFTVASFTVLHDADGYGWSTGLSMNTSIAAAMLAGAVIRNKEEIFADTKARAERAEADRRIEAERAVTRERLRIAREMHDVVAHGMSLITVQAAAAREITATRPEEAARLMQSVETTGRDALADMRRMLGVLRNGERSGSNGRRGTLTPQPTLDDLDTIIAHCTDVGIPTELVIDGGRRPLAPGLELTAFRTVQEALTNVVKHGGDAATATVSLHYGADTLDILVGDTGRGAVSGLTERSSGHGLMGMRERIEIYDGQLVTGPRSGGGYEVKACLPIDVSSGRPAVDSTDREATE